MSWKYYDPKFEYEEKFDDATSPWAGHKFFTYDLVRSIRPKRIVELGTHKGTSLFSFCQATKDEKIDTEINAVDTWKGDEHAGFYGEEVFETVNQIRSKFYPDLKVNLIRKTFNEAVGEFSDNSIDILHVDGLHTYEAVKHDFENWFPKVKYNGIILFHDIHEKHDDFGVYKIWDELKEKHKTIEFHHSHGLGVLFKNKNSLDFMHDFQEIFRKYYQLLHNKKLLECDLLSESPALKIIIEQKDQEIRRKDQEIEFIKSSKFWKLRELYLKIKKELNYE